jgi:HEAT repeat protein
LKESFQELVQGETLTAKPTQDELSSLGKRVSAASPGEIRDALPWMIAAAANADEVKRVYAFRALVGVGVRTDSPALLKEHIGDLVTLLASSDAYVQRFAMIVLGSVQSRQAAPVLGLSQALVAFVKRADRDLQAQLGALGSLLEKWQEEPSVQDAVEGFLSRDLDVETRIQILLALGRGNARGRPVRFIDLIIAALGNPSIDVRTTAIDVLSRSGTPAMVRAEPSLRKLIQEADQPEVVKSAARKALRDAGLSPD